MDDVTRFSALREAGPKALTEDALFVARAYMAMPTETKRQHLLVHEDFVRRMSTIEQAQFREALEEDIAILLKKRKLPPAEAG